MNRTASLATGIREIGVNTSLELLENDLIRLSCLLGEISERIAPIRLSFPSNPVTCGKEQFADEPRCQVDGTIQQLRNQVQGMIDRSESMLCEIKL